MVWRWRLWRGTFPMEVLAGTRLPDFRPRRWIIFRQRLGLVRQQLCVLPRLAGLAL